MILRARENGLQPAESQLELLRPELVIRESTAMPVLRDASPIEAEAKKFE